MILPALLAVILTDLFGVRPAPSGCEWPGFRMKVRAGAVDLSGVRELRLKVRNLSHEPNRVSLVARSSNGALSSADHTVLPADGTGVIRLSLPCFPWVVDDRFFDVSRVVRIDAFRHADGRDLPFEIISLEGVETLEPRDPPVRVVRFEGERLTDEYGQFAGGSWPGKIENDGDLLNARKAEESDLAAHPAPPAAATAFRPTGWFRVERNASGWHLVDPQGREFFSVGMCSVYPADESKRSFVAANLKRKYGESVLRQFPELMVRRLRSWGFNTIGCFSAPSVCKAGLPYVSGFKLDASGLTCGKKGRMPDVFSPGFTNAVRRAVRAEFIRSGQDPNCVGWFSDNELVWETFETRQERERAATCYFSVVSREIRAVAPHRLYLGARFSTGSAPAEVVRIAAEYCDVVTFNDYSRVPEMDIPEGARDRPILFGEFHFGALDRGMPRPGLIAAYDQRERAMMFEEYLRAARRNPRCVGAHWFQLYDEPFEGRNDGENYACGFLSVCDSPYPDMVEAARRSSGSGR